MPQNPGLPKASSVVATIPFNPGKPPKLAMAAPGAAKYQILRTIEVDEYDPPTPVAKAAPPGMVIAAPAGDNFKGTARKVAKISIADAAMQKYADLQALIKTLLSDAKMRAKKISTGKDSDRIDVEKRNVRVKCFLYAASREKDNDYHLILGRDPGANKAMYMTMELSGLPPAGAASFKKLKAARTAYKKFFSTNLPGTSYDFYNPPIPVIIEGSLFWDASHATGGKPGPASLRPKIPNVWEVHPISKITFEP